MGASRVCAITRASGVAGRAFISSFGAQEGVEKIGRDKFQANIAIDDQIHEIGIFKTKEEAKLAYNEWSNLFLDTADPGGARGADPGGADPGGDESSWIEPSKVKRPAFSIPVVDLQQLSIVEVEEAVSQENGDDVSVIDFTVAKAASSRVCDYMVFVTGKSASHMRRMAGVLTQALHKRRLPGDHQIEGRDCDDWMIVDCGNIIVHFFNEEGRKHYDIEPLWRAKADGRELYPTTDLDALCEMFPCPEYPADS